MNSRDFQTYDEYLDYKLANEKNRRNKIVDLRDKQEKARKRKFKTLGVKVTALALTLVTATTALIGLSKKKNKVAPAPTNSIVYDITDDSNNLDSLGIELEAPQSEQKKEYGKTTGNVDINKIVKDDKGTIWVDQKAKDNSKNVGKVVTDTKNGKYEVKDNGKVEDKKVGYEIKDDKGTVIDKGNLPDSGVPAGYSWDKDRKEYVPTEDVGKYVYNDKGELIVKGSQTKTQTVTKTPTTQPIEQKPAPIESTSKGYEVNGLVFETKADYEQWILQGYEGYAEVNGIMKAETNEMKELQKTK